MSAIAYDTEHFSSRSIIMSNFRRPRDIAPIGGSPPISSDPPFHHDARKLLLSAFTKTSVTKQEPATRAFCHGLIDSFAGRDVVDAARDYAQHIPMRVIADILGFRQRTGRSSGSSSRTRSKASTLPPEERIERMTALFDYLLAQVHDHLDRPREDLTTYLIDAESVRPQAGARARRRRDGAAAHRGHRHDVERDRRVPVAPGQEPGRPWPG